MTTPAWANLITFFYPIGNTPAVCLTQNIRPEQRADMLLLGCGDVRNILFTIHTAFRPMDVTCCDLESAIIARNIILLTRIIDDPDGKTDGDNWDIYYHLYIDQEQAESVRAQAKTLHQLASSLSMWNESKYGKVIRFCDAGTLSRVRQLWAFYSTQRSGPEQSRFEESFKQRIQNINKFKNGTESDIELNMAGLRSAAPAQMEAVVDLAGLHHVFLKHGSPDGKAASRLDETFRANPMFTSPDPAVTLHYGSDPIIGFHTARAYVPRVDAQQPSTMPGVSRPVAAAREEFRTWIESFRRHHNDKLTLRFFVGDAIAFAQCLQHHRVEPNVQSANWYRERTGFEPLVLDGPDYGPSGTAPLSFTVIDTSNLSDHLGTLNLLTAASPLLAGKLSATLYTESLVRHTKTTLDLVENILCGDCATMSLLLALVPAGYWTNTSPISGGEEALLNMAELIGDNNAIEKSGQSFVRIAWKRPLTHSDGAHSSSAQLHTLLIEEFGLARLLYRVYLKMFESENIAARLSDISILGLQKCSLPRYHRASFASLLCFARSRVSAEWSKTVEILLSLIETGTTLLMSRNYIQELYLYLHLFGFYSVDTFRTPYNTTGSSVPVGDLRDWTNMPAAVCVTFKVPRARLAVFTDGDAGEVSIPPVHCVVQGGSSLSPSNTWQNIFASVQLGFGEVSTRGKRHTDGFKISITEDPRGWYGNSPLIASFWAPTWMLLLKPQDAVIAFGIQSTPLTNPRFLDRLGLSLDVYETTLGDTQHVYFSKSPPNQARVMCIPGLAGTQITRPEDVSGGTASTSYKADVDMQSGKISSLSGRLNILSSEMVSDLRAKRHVQSNSLSPCDFTIAIGKASLLNLSFPTPVSASKVKTRIARKSGYVELVAPVATSESWKDAPTFMYPVYQGGGSPIAWNTSYLNLGPLPKIDITKHSKLGWLNPHISFMWSGHERALRADPTLSRSEGERTRLDFKDSLHSIFMHFTGLQGKKAHIFGLNNPTGGGVHVILFVSSLKLDVADRTVVLDVAVLPLHDALMPKIVHFLSALTSHGFCQIKVDRLELRLWKTILPAYVERCRTWSHKPGWKWEEPWKHVICVTGSRLKVGGLYFIVRDVARRNTAPASVRVRIGRGIRPAVAGTSSAHGAEGTMFRTRIKEGSELSVGPDENEEDRLERLLTKG
ncbi:hypothetical protein MKZ38_002689 [Zalerion maritima]|uniref:DUF4470 domain-containing protein n=1 Tax=Zalerion maritima TaxID=339359 RepID=A0AAD5WQN6_9PEZI|nr:hypothetical protein MKZ38_002689 [Zalerion maritima]